MQFILETFFWIGHAMMWLAKEWAENLPMIYDTFYRENGLYQ